MRNPYEPPHPAELPRERRKLVERWFGWLEVLAAPSFFAFTTWYHAHDGSSMAGVLWLWSIPTAFIVYLFPGVLLLVAPRWGLLVQVLPTLFTGYLALLALAALLG